MARPRQSSTLAFVHHKRTGEVEIRRADDFSSRLKNTHSPIPYPLHYTSADLSKFCRCSQSQRHKFSSAVSTDSTHLAANLTRYLDKHSLKASSIAHFHAYNKKRHTTWSQEGIRIEDFHYATKQKDVVCRCTKPNNHGRGTVRNQDIVELCAAFFRSNNTRMTCTKAQWRRACEEENNSPDSDSFKYDSWEVQELLHTLQHAPSSLDRPRPSSAGSDMKYFRVAPNGDSDVPEYVWENTRPSLWNGRRGSQTSCSTPLGTSAMPVSKPAHTSERRRQSVPVEQSRRASVATVWSAVQRDAACGAPEFAGSSCRTPSISSRDGRPDVFSFMIPSSPDDKFDRAPVPRTYHPGKSLGRGDCIASAGQETASSNPYPTELPSNRGAPAELHYVEVIAELPTEYAHSPTFRELEDTRIYVDYYDRPGKQPLPNLPISNLHLKQQPVNTPSASQQAHDNVNCPSQTACLANSDLSTSSRHHRASILMLRANQDLTPTQLHLLQDYVTAHAQDTVANSNHAEVPDWYVNVIKPATQLFTGWNKCALQSRDFDDGDDVVEGLAWAELVRWMADKGL